MTFAQPLWFWAFALLPLLAAVFFLNESRRTKLLRQLVAARLQDRLAGSVSVAKRRARFLLLLLALACVIASLTQPRYGYTWQESKRRGRDILIAIDTSKSMLATDLEPNRLTRAKLATQDLIGQLEGDRVGLIAFAGSSFLQAPLTADYSAVLASLAELDTDIIPLGGTNIAESIKAAEDAFGKGESEHRALVIFTDGEELDADGVRAAERVSGAIRIFTVGIGSAEGSLIPLRSQQGGGDFVKDANGQIVKSHLDETRLRKIAEATGGFYVHLLNGLAEMRQIVRDGFSQMIEKDIDAKLSRQPIERYQWPLAAGLALLAASMIFGERRRNAVRRAASVAASIVLAFSALARATNSGVTAYEAEDFKGAMDRFSEQIKRRPGSEALHFDLGAAAYKAGEFDRALESFSRAVTSPDLQLHAKAEYNLGNTLFQRGAAQKQKEPKVREWKDAVQHYDEALKVDPKNDDATYNRDLVRKMIEELEKEPPKNDEQKKDDKKNDEKKDKSQQQKGGGQDKEQKQDQQKSDSEEKKDGEQKDQQNQQSKDGEDKKEQPQPGDKKDEQKEGQGAEKKDEGMDGKNEPQPAPEQPDKKKEGEVQAAPQHGKDEGDPQEQVEADALAAATGKMTERDAKALLDSLKSEDDRVPLRDPNERRKNGRVLRDW